MIIRVIIRALFKNGANANYNIFSISFDEKEKEEDKNYHLVFAVIKSRNLIQNIK